MMKWLGENINYPEEAAKKNIQGRVIVQFVVETNGTISNIEVIKSMHKLLDAEAMRVVGAMPKWKPGTLQDGKAVRVRYTLPVQFALQGKKAEADKGQVFERLDDMPDYPGGMKAMMQFLSNNTIYPKEAIEQNIQGRVIVTFVVEADGSLSDISIARGIHELLDAEAIRVIKLMPKWKPGVKDGEPVRARFTVPVQFKLSVDEESTPENK